ncbi:hypothetical protein ACP179_19495 [Xenorhabdus stockiae]|uniref:hypothetical protein n=1 Tax=Xenorhabdus stockiae TaxID=351614 RepID=UPI003CED64C6
MAVQFLIARGNPKTPPLGTTNSFAEFSQFILSKRAEIAILPGMNSTARNDEKRKLYWFAPPTKQKGMLRRVGNMAACAFGCADIDESTPGAAAALVPVLTRYSMLMYHTASSTPENPRIRLVCEFSRLVEPDERRAISTAFESALMQEAGFTFDSFKGEKARWVKENDYLVFDRSVYYAQSYVYCPHVGAESATYHGEVVDVDLLPLPVTALQSDKATSKKEPQHVDEADFSDIELIDEHLISDLRSALWHPEMLKQAQDNKTWSNNGYEGGAFSCVQPGSARYLYLNRTQTIQIRAVRQCEPR